MTDPNSTERQQLTALLQNPGAYLDIANAEVRRVAVAASSGDDQLIPQLVEMLADDPAPTVRRECAEVLGQHKLADPSPLVAALNDDAAEVREAAVTALGEIAATASLAALITLASDEDEDKLVREAAVAALGAIGDPGAVPTLLRLIAEGPPQVRRRCAAALSVFDGDEVETALRTAAEDRNPMVREAAEMVVGRTAE
jgi:HEAT repeat protein